MKIKLLLILTLSIINYQAKAVDEIATEPVVIAQKITLNSQVLKQHRDIYVSLPQTYGIESTNYPVLFVLDGDFFIKMADFIAKDLAVSHQIEDMIVVAISQKNRHQELKEPGAHQFLKFIKSEVFQYISENYRTSNYKVLFGHSLGGSFSLFSLMNEPDLFNAYMAVSPVLDTKGTPELGALKTFLSESEKQPNYLFLSKANEQGNYEKTIPDLAKFLKQYGPKNFRWTYKEYPFKSHGSVPMFALVDSLSELYKNRIMPEIGELNDFNSMEDIKKIGGYEAVKNYYTQYSKKLSFNFPVPSIVYSRFAWIYFNDNQHELLAKLVKNEGKDSEVVNYYLGSSYLQKKDFKRAIDLMKSDLKLNPKHLQGWYILGLAYRDSGNITDALKALRKSVELAQGNQLLTEYQDTYNQLLKNQ